MILSLPDEILTQCFQFLLLRDLGHVALSCRRLNRLSREMSVIEQCHLNTFGPTLSVIFSSLVEKRDIDDKFMRRLISKCKITAMDGCLFRMVDGLLEQSTISELSCLTPNSLNILLNSAVKNQNIEVIRKVLECQLPALPEDTVKLACQNGNREIVKMLIQAGADINDCFVMSFKHSQFELAEDLVRDGANIRAQSDMALRWAVDYGLVEGLRLLIRHDLQFEGLNRNAILLSIQNNHEDMVRLLLEHINDRDILREALGWAGHQGNAKIYEMLLHSLDDISRDNSEAILWPYLKGHDAIVSILESRGLANLSVDDRLIIAARHGRIDELKELIKIGNPNAREGLPLLLAAKHDQADVIDILLCNGALYPSCVLGMAVSCGNVRAVEKLLSHNADPAYNDHHPVIAACSIESVKILDLMVEYGGDIHAKDETPLISSVSYQRVDVLERLVSLGANVSARNDLPLKMAIQKGFTDIVKILLKERAQDPQFNINRCVSEELLSTVISQGNTKLLGVLRSHGVTCSWRSLYISLEKGNPGKDVLVDYLGGVDYSKLVPKRMEEMLRNACKNADLAVVSYLLFLNFHRSHDIDISDDGLLEYAIKGQKRAILECLLQTLKVELSPDSYLFDLVSNTNDRDLMKIMVKHLANP